MSCAPSVPAAPLLVLALTSLTPPAAWAASAGGDDSSAGTVVVYGGDGPGEAAASAARVAAGAPAAEALWIGDVAPDAGGGPRLYGAPERAACRGEPISAQAMERLLDQCRQALQDLSLDGAAEVFDQATAAVPCADEVIPPQTLTDLFFYRGLLDVYDGRPDDAVRRFREALAIKPDRQWDPTYPPEAFQVYLEAMEQHYLARRVELSLLLDDPASAPTLLDGVPLAADATAVDLAPGDHLLQVQPAGAAVTTVQFTVEGDQTLLLASDAAVGELILRGPRAPRHGWAAAERLRELARRRGAGELLVVDGRFVYRFEPGTGLFVVVREPLDRHTRAYRAGVALTITGSAAASAGAILAAAAFATSPASPAHPDYDRSYRAHNAGWVMVASGGALAAVGVPLAASNRPSRTAAVSCVAGRDRVVVGIGGAW